MLYFNNLHVYLHLWKAGLLWPACWTPCASLATHVSWKLTGKGVQDWYLFPYKHRHIRMSFFFAIYNWIYQIFLTSEPKENWKKKERKKEKNRFAVLFSRSSKRAITDQIFSELEEIWLSILLGFRKHVRYVACMRAWTVEKKAQPRHWEIVWKKKEKISLNFCLLKNFETKMTNLVSDLFILRSVHPMWGKDGVR